MKNIEKNDLILDIKEALADIFVAEITEEEGALNLCFLNGQNFSLCVKEN